MSMDYKVLAERLKYPNIYQCPFSENKISCKKWQHNIYDEAATAITDLLTRAEAAEYELEQRKGYYDQMVDALAAVDSRELEEAKEKLKAAEARVRDLETAFRTEKCEHGPECVELGRVRKALAEAEARAEKAERERDAAIKELDDVAAAVDDLSDFIDEQIHPLVQYDMYLALRENADAISMWQYEAEWRGHKEE